MKNSLPWNLAFFFALAAGGLVLVFPLVALAEPAEVGYRDFMYGTAVSSSPTGEKPESKLWWNDGAWWGSLWSPAAGAYHIFRLDLTGQAWIDTGVALDDRANSKADALWDGKQLYIASHVFATVGAPTVSSWGRLYRYSYDPVRQAYSLDEGFPVDVTRGKSETLVLEKDTTGTLWVTYVESQQVMVNHSLGGDDRNWGEPYVLPVSDASGLDNDDISSLIAYQAQVGLIWSNQVMHTVYFAAHPDSDADDRDWQAVTVYNPGGQASDDHINLKSLQTDGSGSVFAVVKTSFTAGYDPQIVLLACQAGSCTSQASWNAHTVYRVQDNQTRAILLIDTDNRELHVFSTHLGTSATIQHKVASIDSIQFPQGGGEEFIKSDQDVNINNATSSKQNVNHLTGLVVLASDTSTNTYLHNTLDLTAASPTDMPTPTSTATSTATATPTSFQTFIPAVVNSSTATHIQVKPPTVTSPSRLFALSTSTLYIPSVFKRSLSGQVFETRPYTPDSPWNTPIGSSPRYDPHSVQMVATLGKYSEGRITSNPNEYSYTLYFTDASTPRWDVPCASENCTVVRPEGISKASVLRGVPIPPGAKPAGGSDAPMIVVDGDTLDEYNLRGVVRTATGWTADNGALYNITYNGTPTRYSTRGSGVPYFAGLIRPWEVAQGRIEHVIGFAYPSPAVDRCVYPASKTDGDNPDPNSIPEGARLQLDPSLTEADFDRLGLDRTGKIIARALQQYGMVVVNVSGRPKITVENLADNPYAPFQWSDAPYNLTATSIAAIPYTYFRVLALPESYWNPALGGPMHGKCYK